MLNEIDGQYLANAAVMSRTARRVAVMMVEGESDCKLLSKFIAGRRCVLFPAHGKENALAALSILRKREMPGVLAFVDADFDRILDRVVVDDDVIVSDCHDTEMMIIFSESLDHLLEEYASKPKIETFRKASEGLTVRRRLLQEAAKIGVIRLASAREGWSLRFAGIDFKKIVDVRTLIVSVKKVVAVVLANSASGHPTAEHVLDYLEAHRADGATMLRRETAIHQMEQAMGKKNEHLCQWKKSDRTEDVARYRKIVRKAKFFCKDCGRAAGKKKWLCQPHSLVADRDGRNPVD